jgi:hypothetical protein
MSKWLALAAATAMVAPGAALAQIAGLAAPDVANVAKSRQLDFRLSQQQGSTGPLPLVGGMVAQRDLSPNAFVGLGLANMYSRKKRGDARINDPPRIARKPAVTFVLKF